MLVKGVFLLSVVILRVVTYQSLPRFEFHGHHLPSNSLICNANIGNQEFALKCVTDSTTCCTNPNVGTWTDDRGRQVQEGTNGTSCLYVTRGHGVITLNRKSGCTDHTSGLWRCDIPDSSGVMQSLYVDIKSYGRFT